ncbi:MAG: hypothetical protein IT442_07995 [Phycisphaeraceae bacterium]|nr:hypothetical protein [Phycisphaeraceae bacterium]
MAFVYYVANGYTSRDKTPGQYQGKSEFRLRNLAERQTTIRQRLYFADRPPLDLAPISAGPMGGPYQEFPQHLPESHKDAGPWGVRVVSDTPLAYVHIALTRRNGKTEDIRYAGGCGMQLGKQQLSCGWYFGDCFKWFVKPVDPPFPFSQYEWYHLLNPNPLPAHITLTVGDEKRGPYHKRQITIEPERVLFLDDPDLVEGTMAGCYVKIQSDQPILAEGERVIFGPQGPDEWGVIIGCASPGACEPFLDSTSVN